MMDFKIYKKEIEKEFEKFDIDIAEVNILFCEALNCNIKDLLFKNYLNKREIQRINSFVKQRLDGRPIQKIFKRAYFFDYTFFVNDNVLCPRPETELLTIECVNYIKDKYKDKISDVSVLDLCTGSGCIAITINKMTKSKTYASDISQKALDVAKRNCKKLDATVKFIKSNMFKNINQKFDVIISNPPYIKTEDISFLDKEVKDYDPILALDGGSDGLDFYRIIADQSKAYLNKNGRIFLEVGINEAKSVKDLLIKNGFDCYIKKDYNDIDRIVIGELR